MKMPFVLLWCAACLLYRGATFPVDYVETNTTTLERLRSGESDRDGLSTALLLPLLQRFFKEVGNQIRIEKGDVIVTANFPDTQVDDSCGHSINVLHPQAVGTIEKSSNLSFGMANISWHAASVFADAEVDSSLDIGGDVRVQTGVKVFRHCRHLARKTVGIDVISTGHTGLGLSLSASNAHVALVNGTLNLIFNFHASVVGKVLKWNVDTVKADKCKIKILGVEIGSVCGTIERHLKDKAQNLLDKVVTLTVPSLLKKLEDRVNTKIGSVVSIPLKISSTSASSDAQSVRSELLV